MELWSTYLLALITLFPVTRGYTNPCTTTEQHHFLNKYCHNEVSATRITNGTHFTQAFGICFSESMDLLGMMKENFENRQFLMCKEIYNCMTDITSVITACKDLIQQVLPPELRSPNEPFNHKKLAEIRDRTNRLFPAFYAALGILLIVGIVANGLLVIIFSRHKNARNDVMLINLTVANVLSLTINLPIVIVIISAHLNSMDVVKTFTFTCHLCIFISEYSLIIMSFEQFRAVSKLAAMQNEIIFPCWKKITGLWILGMLYGLSHYLTLEALVSNWMSFGNSLKMIYILTYITMMVEGVVPLFLITVFSVLATKGLKKLANNFPGERNHALEHIQAQYLGLEALIPLAILSLFSYVPFSIAQVTLLNYYPNLQNMIMNFLDFETWTYVFISTFVVMFLNSALNPLVLYFTNYRFRQYLKSYLCCKIHQVDWIPVTRFSYQYIHHEDKILNTEENI